MTNAKKYPLPTTPDCRFVYDTPEGSVEVSKLGRGYYFAFDKYDTEFKSAADARKALRENSATFAGVENGLYD